MTKRKSQKESEAVGKLCSVKLTLFNSFYKAWQDKKRDTVKKVAQILLDKYGYKLGFYDEPEPGVHVPPPPLSSFSGSELAVVEDDRRKVYLDFVKVR
jgi:hypothetical protein